MTIRTKNESAHKMSSEETAAVKAGMADFVSGKILSEEQFQEEMRLYLERRQAEIAKAPSSR